jgi:hypothetical protein
VFGSRRGPLHPELAMWLAEEKEYEEKEGRRRRKDLHLC